MSESDARILVVDDNEDNRFTLIRRLQRQGYARASQLSTSISEDGVSSDPVT